MSHRAQRYARQSVRSERVSRESHGQSGDGETFLQPDVDQQDSDRTMARSLGPGVN